MSELYGVIGRSNPTQLLADPQGADVIAIPCEPGNGTVARGTVMYRKASGLYAPAANGDVTTSNMLVVINEDVETGETITAGAVAEDAAAYRAGRFVDGAVTLASGSALSAANKVVLRLQNIVFDQTESAAEFENGTVKITYVANNNADPAEDDQVFGTIKGQSYTILANTVTKFTAPATKSFSKWNTEADGSGDDYSAASSYTADEDLTLYAVWA